MQQSEMGEPKRARPRSFVGGGSIGFTYDKHHGGIKDSDEPEENEDKKQKRPLSLYEMFSKDMMIGKENSSSPSKPDGAKSFERLNSQEKAQDMNRNKIRRRVSSEKGEEGLGNRKMSDSGSREAAKALYVELSSTPKVVSPNDEKFNAVSRLRSLFDQGSSAPVLPRTSSDKRKPTTHQSVAQDNQDHSKKDEPDVSKRHPKFEKIDMERKKKLFGPPAPIKLDDLLKRDSPKSPDEVTLPKLRKSFPLTREPFEKRDARPIPSTRADKTAKKPLEKDVFDEIHTRRRSMPKQRSSSFEFEGLEDNIQVYGRSSIDVSAMLGLDSPNEDPIAEENESKTKDEDDERMEKFDEDSKDEQVQMTEQNNDPVEVVEEKSDTLVDEKVDSLMLEPIIKDQTIKMDECDLEVGATVQHVKKDLIDEVVFDENKKEDMPLEMQLSLLDNSSTAECATQEEISLKGEMEISVDEELIMPKVEESVEAGIDFNTLDNTEVVSESNDSIIMECDSFDSFALHMKHNEKEVTEDVSDSETSFISASLDESKNVTVEQIRADIKSDYVQDENNKSMPTDEDETDMNDVSKQGLDGPVDIGEEVLKIVEEVSVESSDYGNKSTSAVEDDDEKKENEPLEESREESEEVQEEIEAVAMHAENLEEAQDVDEKACDQFIERESNEEASLGYDEAVSQMSIIASVAGLSKEDLYENDKNEEIKEEAICSSAAEKKHESEDESDDVEAEKEDYDIDEETGNEEDIEVEKRKWDIEVEEGKEEDSEEENEEDITEEEVQEEDIAEEEEKEDIEDEEGKELEDEASEEKETMHETVTLDDDEYDSDSNTEVKPMHEDNIALPPAPPHSCLSMRNAEKKKERKVSFQNDGNNVIFTYSAQEYNRSNSEIDALTASAEWELEKRVEEKDMFTVDLDKSNGGLGLSIIGLGVGTDSGVEKLGIFVKSLTPNGAAAKDRRIQVHDQILEVNGISLVGVTQDFAANTLRNTSGNVRFMMGRDKGKRYYQAPTSTAEPVLQELEKKHNLELGEITSRLQKTETRAAISEHNLDEVREALAEAEERVHLLEEELENANKEVEHMKESPFYLHKSLKNEIKRPKHERRSNEKIGNLEKSISELTNKLSYSEENLDKIQQESDERISELQTMLEEAEKNLIAAKNDNNNFVSMLEENSRKLSEAEECLAAANHSQENTLKEIKELREKCSELEMEIEKLRDKKLELEQLKLSKEVEKVLMNEEQNVMAVKDTDENENLLAEINHLSEEVSLRNQFADIVVAERDSLKALVASLEEAQAKQLEAQEKKDIETSMKMMAYEHKVKELEDKIKKLEEKQIIEHPKQKKLFPDIEKEIKILKDVRHDKLDGAHFKAFELPPRDYDDDDSPLEGNETHLTEVDVQIKSEEEIVSKSRKSSSSSSSSSNEESENEAGKEIVIESKLIEERDVAIAEEAPVIPDVMKIEESSPVLIQDTAIEESDATPVVSIDAEVDKQEINTEKSILCDSPVNPVQKPPRTYSDVTHVRVEKQLRSSSLKSKGLEQSLTDSGENGMVKKEKQETSKEDKNEEVNEKVNNEKAVLYQVLIEKNYESKPFDENILGDLPESLVDSDSELIERGEMKPEANISQEIEIIVTEDTALQIQDSIDESIACDTATITAHDIPSDVIQSMNADESKNETNASVVKECTINEQSSVVKTEDDNIEKSTEKDRSSFIEAFSKDPSFGSWFSGNMTIIDQEKDDDQADEIASKVMESKARSMSSSSSSSKSSTIKEELNTSIKLDESYLQKSQVHIEADETDSPLNRMESVDTDSPLSEQAKIDDLNQVQAAADRPLSTNFDDLPVTEVLPNTAQHDKRKLASAIQRKSPKPINKKSLIDEAVEPVVILKDVPKDEVTITQGATASTENLAVNIDYAKKDPEKEKRKSFFGFLTKLGGKKKHRKSMENLLAVDEGEGSSKENKDEHRKENVDEEDGVVPLEMQRDVQIRMSSDSGVETHHATNGVSSDTSDSIVSSPVTSPASSSIIAESDDSSSPPKNEDELSWLQRPVIEWDVRQVGLWLIQLELGQYSQTFQERNIDGHELMSLNGARLKDLGVVNYDHRALIKKNIKEFRAKPENKMMHDAKREGKARDKISKKIFWRGKYTVNE